MGKAKQAEDIEQLKKLYENVLLVRRVETQLSELFADGAVPGFIHLSIGQEATSVGVVSQLRDEDTVASTHRGHGHALSKGLSLEGFFAELLGKDDGLCRGRGGSMHVADLSLGMLGANGIVGAGMSIATGSALAHKVLGRKAIAVSFFGDGALAEGVLHESLNFAKLLKLPVLFVCENNGWSEFSPTEKQIAFSLDKLASAFDIPYETVDGNDVWTVYTSAKKVIAGMRKGKSPAILECKTTRVRGHFEGDAQKYRNAAEIEGLSDRDPVRLAANRLKAKGFTDNDFAEIEESVNSLISKAVENAKQGKDPDFSEALADVYTRVEG